MRTFFVSFEHLEGRRAEALPATSTGEDRYPYRGKLRCKGGTLDVDETMQEGAKEGTSRVYDSGKAGMIVEAHVLLGFRTSLAPLAECWRSRVDWTGLHVASPSVKPFVFLRT